MHPPVGVAKQDLVSLGIKCKLCRALSELPTPIHSQVLTGFRNIEAGRLSARHLDAIVPTSAASSCPMAQVVDLDTIDADALKGEAEKDRSAF